MQKPQTDPKARPETTSMRKRGMRSHAGPRETRCLSDCGNMASTRAAYEMFEDLVPPPKGPKVISFDDLIPNRLADVAKAGGSSVVEVGTGLPGLGGAGAGKARADNSTGIEHGLV